MMSLPSELEFQTMSQLHLASWCTRGISQEMKRKAGEHPWAKARQSAAYHQKLMISMPLFIHCGSRSLSISDIQSRVWTCGVHMDGKQWLIDSLTHKEMERTGHEEVNFPLLIPENSRERKRTCGTPKEGKRRRCRP